MDLSVQSLELAGSAPTVEKQPLQFKHHKRKNKPVRICPKHSLDFDDMPTPNPVTTMLPTSESTSIKRKRPSLVESDSVDNINNNCTNEDVLNLMIRNTSSDNGADELLKTLALVQALSGQNFMNPTILANPVQKSSTSITAPLRDKGVGSKPDEHNSEPGNEEDQPKSFGKTILYPSAKKILPAESEFISNFDQMFALNGQQTSAVIKNPSQPGLDNFVLQIADRFRSGPMRLWMVAGDTLQLWQFLLQLLLDEPYLSATMPDYTPPIYWTGRGWEFKISNSEVTAKLWGMYKNCPRMNYAKLARGLRFYYGKNIVMKTPIPFVYTFYDDKVNNQAIDGANLRTKLDNAKGAIDNEISEALVHLESRSTMGDLINQCNLAFNASPTVANNSSNEVVQAFEPTQILAKISRQLSQNKSD